jgi:VanZ family protein
MAEPGHQPRFWPITVLIAVVIVYGSLYPFEFRPPPGGTDAITTFLASVGQRPGRSDALANILLYTPFGFFFCLGRRRIGRLILTTATGSVMSLCLELAQFYDPGRVTSFSDFATNTLGTLLGGLAAIAVGDRFRLPFVGHVATAPAPTLLLLSWLAYRLYPYVPSTDLHKYWNALKPLVLTPSLTGYDLFRQTAIWLTVFVLIEAILRRRLSAFIAPLFAVAVLCAKVLIVGIVIRLADPAGAALAFAIWLLLLLLPARLSTGMAALVLLAYVTALRLEPFEFQADGREFGWIPFRSLMQGSLRANTLAFLEKFFLYGSLVYLLGNALGRRLPAALLIAALLFATSWAETWLPGRSAEITDALIALIAAAIFALLPAAGDAGSTLRPARLTARQRQLRDWQKAQARALGVEADRGRRAVRRD